MGAARIFGRRITQDKYISKRGLVFKCHSKIFRRLGASQDRCLDPQFSDFYLIRHHHQMCIRGEKKKWRLHALLARLRTEFEIVALAIAEKRNETQEDKTCLGPCKLIHGKKSHFRRRVARIPCATSARRARCRTNRGGCRARVCASSWADRDGGHGTQVGSAQCDQNGPKGDSIQPLHPMARDDARTTPRSAIRKLFYLWVASLIHVLRVPKV